MSGQLFTAIFGLAVMVLGFALLCRTRTGDHGPFWMIIAGFLFFVIYGISEIIRLKPDAMCLLGNVSINILAKIALLCACGLALVLTVKFFRSLGSTKQDKR